MDRVLSRCLPQRFHQPFRSQKQIGDLEHIETQLAERPQDIIQENKRLYYWDYDERKLASKKLKKGKLNRSLSKLANRQLGSTFTHDPSAIQLPESSKRLASDLGWDLRCIPNFAGISPNIPTNQIVLSWVGGMPSGKGMIAANYIHPFDGILTKYIEPKEMEAQLTAVIQDAQSNYEASLRLAELRAKEIQKSKPSLVHCEVEDLDEKIPLPSLVVTPVKQFHLVYKDHLEEVQSKLLTGQELEKWSPHSILLTKLHSLREDFVAGRLGELSRPPIRNDFFGDKEQSIYLWQDKFYYYSPVTGVIESVEINVNPKAQLAELRQNQESHRQKVALIREVCESLSQTHSGVTYELTNASNHNKRAYGGKPPSNVLVRLIESPPSENLIEISWFCRATDAMEVIHCHLGDLHENLINAGTRKLASLHVLREDLENDGYTVHDELWEPGRRDTYPCFQIDKSDRLFLFKRARNSSEPLPKAIAPGELEAAKEDARKARRDVRPKRMLEDLLIPTIPRDVDARYDSLSAWRTNRDGSLTYQMLEDGVLQPKTLPAVKDSIQLKKSVLQALDEQKKSLSGIDEWQGIYSTKPELKRSLYRSNRIPKANEIQKAPTNFLFRVNANQSVTIFYLKRNTREVNAYTQWISPDSLETQGQELLLIRGNGLNWIQDRAKTLSRDITIALGGKESQAPAKDGFVLFHEAGRNSIKVSYKDPSEPDTVTMEVPVKDWKGIPQTLHSINQRRRKRTAAELRQLHEWDLAHREFKLGGDMDLQELSEKFAAGETWITKLSLAYLDPFTLEEVLCEVPVNHGTVTSAIKRIGNIQKGYHAFSEFSSLYASALQTPDQHQLGTAAPDQWHFKEHAQNKAVVRYIPEKGQMVFSFCLQNGQVFHIESDPDNAITYDSLASMLHQGHARVELHRTMNVDPSSFQRTCQAEALRVDDIKGGVDLTQLLTWFDDGNWSDPGSPGYVNPKSLTDDGKTRTRAHIRAGLKKYVSGVTAKKGMWLLPKGSHCDTLQSMAQHIVLAGQKDPNIRLEIAVRLGEIGNHCGARIMNGTRQEYLIRTGQLNALAVSSGLESALNQMILPAMMGAVEALIAGISFAHGANWIYRCLGSQNIPLPETIKGDYSDEYQSKVVSDDPKEVVRQYLMMYEYIFTNMIHDQINREMKARPASMLKVQEALLAYAENHLTLPSGRQADLETLEAIHKSKRSALKEEQAEAQEAYDVLVASLAEDLDEVKQLAEEILDLRAIRTHDEVSGPRLKALEANPLLQRFIDSEAAISNIQASLERNDEKFAGDKSNLFSEVVSDEQLLISDEYYTEFELTWQGAYALAVLFGHLYKTA